MISKFIGKEQGKYERERAKSNNRDTSGTKKMQKKKKQITGVWKIVWCDNNVMISSILGGCHTY